MHWESKLLEGIARLSEEPFDIVISDLSFPECTLAETASCVSAMGLEAPVIVLTDLDSADYAIDLMSRGVQDYFVKHAITTDALVRAIRHSIARHKSCLEVAELRNQLELYRERIERSESELRSVVNQSESRVNRIAAELDSSITDALDLVASLQQELGGSRSETRLVRDLYDSLSQIRESDLSRGTLIKRELDVTYNI